MVIISFVLSITERPLTFEGFENNFAGGFIGVGLFAAMGWVVALPFVVLLRRKIIWKRCGWLLLIGTAIGPTVILLIDIIGLFVSPSTTGHFDLASNMRIMSLSLAVAFLTTLFYLRAQVQTGEAS